MVECNCQGHCDTRSRCCLLRHTEVPSRSLMAMHLIQREPTASSPVPVHRAKKKTTRTPGPQCRTVPLSSPERGLASRPHCSTPASTSPQDARNGPVHHHGEKSDFFNNRRHIQPQMGRIGVFESTKTFFQPSAGKTVSLPGFRMHCATRPASRSPGPQGARNGHVQCAYVRAEDGKVPCTPCQAHQTRRSRGTHCVDKTSHSFSQAKLSGFNDETTLPTRNGGDWRVLHDESLPPTDRGQCGYPTCPRKLAALPPGQLVGLL